MIADLGLGTYLRSEPGGGLLVGGTEPECDPMDWLDDPDAANPNPTQTVFDAQVTRAARRFSELGVPSSPGATPVRLVTEYTGATINLGAFSRRRPLNTSNSGTVVGWPHRHGRRCGCAWHRFRLGSASTR